MTETYNPLFDSNSAEWFCWGDNVPGCGVVIKSRRLLPISERSMSICGKQRENRYFNKTSAKARQHQNNCEKCGSAKHETAAHNKVSADEVEKRLMIARAVLGE